MRRCRADGGACAADHRLSNGQVYYERLEAAILGGLLLSGVCSQA
jgi:hypothetical protein